MRKKTTVIATRISQTSKCNRTKRDKDDTDYRKIVEDEYKEDCIFCQKSKSKDIILENEYAFAVLDGFPISEGHTLITVNLFLS